MLGLSRSRRRWVLVLTAALLAVSVGVGVLVYRAFFGYAVSEAKDLRVFVRAKPPVPIVFTSRTEPTAFEAAAPEAEGFTYPGTIPWAAREGRLRLLATDGKVYELTWGRPLPDGGTLIDVMSPSVSLDGKRILFAGRKAPPDHGHWRIYQVNVDGRDLKPLTGGPDDPGCIAVPPMRFAADGSRMADDQRRRIDYDDVDPADCGDGATVFASSRIPDLGRDHARRATQIWRRTAAGEYQPMSANRNNDRWPVLISDDWVMWSLWSRNREAITADQTEVRPVSEAGAYATVAPENWMAARITADGIHFGYMVKIPEPVWRPRPLFNGRIAFMTPDPTIPGFRVVQAPVGSLRIAPSSQSGGPPLPTFADSRLIIGPSKGADGRPFSAGCPSPCPPSDVLFSAGPVGASPGEFGLWRVADDWTSDPMPEPLFNDPALVDAEPVAIYRRGIDLTRRHPVSSSPPSKLTLSLLSGRTHRGAFGELESHFLNTPLEYPIPNDTTDAGHGPVFTNPTGVKSVAIYGAHRDRFDHPERPRVPGEWEKLLVADLNASGEVKTWLPADPLMPTVLAGLGEDGKVFKWSSPATDSTGRSASFYAYAGDHYSGMRPNGYVFCNGCHTGHTFLGIDATERMR